MQLILSAVFVGAAAMWIRRFLDSKRTPAGLAKLTDDDIFRMIFTSIGALLGLLLVWVVWPALELDRELRLGPLVLAR